jgi:hypothetical protein
MPEPVRDIPPGQLRYALAAAARGWYVFPVAVGDKPPARGVTNWEAGATTDPDLIRRWWAHTPYNIGIACGPSGLVVVDCDKPKVKDGKEGLRPPPPWDLPGVQDGSDVLALICERAAEPFPFETFQVSTRSGGLHLYFTAPDGARLTNTGGDKGNGLGWLIDTRAWGGCVLGPGSHVSLPDGTGTYRVLHNTTPAPLPTTLFKQLFTPPRKPGPPLRLDLPADRRGNFLRAAIDGEHRRVADSKDGRNNALFFAATALGQLVAGGALAASEATTLLEQWGEDTGLPASEVRLTVASGLRNGARRPRSLTA